MRISYKKSSHNVTTYLHQSLIQPLDLRIQLGFPTSFLQLVMLDYRVILRNYLLFSCLIHTLFVAF